MLARVVPLARVNQLAHDLCGAITLRSGGQPGAHDATLESVVTHSIRALLADIRHPATAAERVANQLRSIGEREAASGRGFRHVEEAFALAEETANTHLSMLLMNRELGRGIVSAVRPSLNAYIAHLLAHARRGYDDHAEVADISRDEALRALRRLAFDAQAISTPEHLCQIARRAGLQDTDRLVALIGMGGALSPTFRSMHVFIPGLVDNEGIWVLPANTTVAERDLVDGCPDGLLIVGPQAKLNDLGRALTSARRAAAMVSARLLPRPDGVLLCETILGRLASCSDPFLTRLLVDKHLGILAGMKPDRRCDLAELLLEWLESGRPINDLARDLHVSPATLHSRMRVLRKHFGDSLDDSDARLELVMALRVMVPLWREGAAR